MLEGDHKRKKVVIPAKLVLELIGEREIRGAFTKLAFNLIVKRKSRYYDNLVKKLSFPRKRESRETLISNSSFLLTRRNICFL